ncbi:hypothetical protein [Sphingomonas sp. 3-13AW]|uniref:hypothetical protein n=1 Tax=Sphingomonas sp. 3-13AW TaxID=3050450 RepID=UPI003BB80C3E
MDLADVLATMTGTGAGSRVVTIAEVPEEQRETVRMKVAEMDRQGLGPATISRRANGSYSVLSGVKMSRSLSRSVRKP